MKTEQLVEQAKAIIESENEDNYSLLTEALEFLRVYAGEKSSFYKQLYDKTKNIQIPDGFDFVSNDSEKILKHVQSCLNAFIRFAEKGLLNGVSIKRQAEIDVINDILSQAKKLLDTKGLHSASSCALSGAVLEEFLRNWVEEQNLSLENTKPSIDSYMKVLYENKFIDKQDTKDITAWGGLRNHAAHGEWEYVSDKKRIEIMLEGINHFMRKYSK
jgi:hypothetical protein